MTITAYAKISLALPLLGLAVIGCDAVEPRLTESEICDASRQAHAESAGFEVGHIASCDFANMFESDEGEELQVLRHNGYCREAVCGSVLMGWFAVNTATGAVYEWDVGEQRLGAPITTAEGQ